LKYDIYFKHHPSNKNAKAIDDSVPIEFVIYNGNFDFLISHSSSSGLSLLLAGFETKIKFIFLYKIYGYFNKNNLEINSFFEKIQKRFPQNVFIPYNILNLLEIINKS
jgi:hypothetical protein